MSDRRMKTHNIHHNIFFNFYVILKKTTKVSPLTSHKTSGAILRNFRELFKKHLDHERLNNDVFLLRWLIAREFDLNKAETMLHAALVWRRENGIDGLLLEHFPEDFPTRFPFSFAGKDKDGRAIFLFKLGQWNMKGACEQGEKDLLVRWMDFALENGLHECSRSRWRSDETKIHSQMLIVADFKGFSFYQLMNKQAIQSILDLVHHFDHFYPEIMYRGFVVNAPAVFSIVWKMICNLLPIKTLSKISLYGCNQEEWMSTLLQYVELHQLASSLGGLLQDA